MKITADSKLEKSIIKFFKFVIVFFSLIMILDFIVGQQFGFENSYLGNKKEVVLEFRKHNIMILTHSSYKSLNGVQTSSLSYILIPKNMSFPSIFSIFENPDGSINYEHNESIWAIFVMLLPLYGIYLIGTYIKLRSFPRELKSG